MYCCIKVAKDSIIKLLLDDCQTLKLIFLVAIPRLFYVIYSKLMCYFTDSFPLRREICMRGFSIFQGYYKGLEKTTQVLDSKEWHRSGDISMLDEERSLVVIDEQNIFVFDIYSNKKIKVTILERLFTHGKEAGVNGFELPKDCMSRVHAICSR
ncbi:hypothetical protein K501DRAFT_276075 [Backusella circina FSU 941]|nr:hypothetical protein K501DRAFT_276075 [Backusella circina FSU 941]